MVINEENRIGMGKNNYNMTHPTQKLIETSGMTLVEISEGWAALQFNPPLRVDWSIYRDSSHPAEEITIAYITFDFGLEYKINPIATKNSGWAYQGVTPQSTNEEVIKSIIRYDLFHAFTHYHGGPNYSHLHWALWGCLKDQVKVVEHFEKFEFDQNE